MTSVIPSTTTSETTSTFGEQAEADELFALTYDLYIYGLAVVIPIGLVYNAVSVVVFVTSTRLRRTTTGQYLAILAVADFVVLADDFVRWLNLKGNAHSYYVGGGVGSFMHR